MFDINWIQQAIKSQNYYFSRHGDQERQNDNLSIQETEDAMINGRILEQYTDTGRGASCLVAGFTNAGKPLHVVCGKRNSQLAIITVYVPGPPQFKNPFERG